MAKNKKKKEQQEKIELAESFVKKSQSFKRAYSSAEQGFINVFRFISNWIDRILFNERFGKLIAVCIATIICVIVNTSSRGNIFSNNMLSAVDLKGIEVVSDISDSVYEVSDLPETVDVTITGDTSDVQYASQQADRYQVLANLADLGEGTHEITFEPLNFSSKVDVNIKPNTAIVTIRKKISRSFTLGYDFINTNQMDKIYSLATPIFSQNEVSVRASEATMSEISYVKALIDVDGVKADFEQEAKIVAYNHQGEQVKVDILPETVNVMVSVTSPRKSVPIRIVPKGTIPDDKAIESYVLDNDNITIYAPEDILDGISNVDVVIPVTKIKEDTTITIPIKLPSGVNKGNITKVNVKLKLAKKESRTIDNISIAYKNINEGLKARTANGVESFSVKIEGAKSLIDSIKASDIEIIADLSDYTSIGDYSVQLSVKGKNKLATYILANDEVEIVLNKGE